MVRHWLAVLITCGSLASLSVQAAEEASVVPESAVQTASAALPEIAPVSSDTTETFRLKDEVQREDGQTMGQASLQMLLGLMAVLGLIIGLAWLARRLNMGMTGSVANMRVMGALSVGAKEKILLVDVDNQRLLLGVTPQQITVLKEMGEAPEPAQASDFAQRMQSLLKAGSINEK